MQNILIIVLAVTSSIFLFFFSIQLVLADNLENYSSIRMWGGTCSHYSGEGCKDPDGSGPLSNGDGQFDSIKDIGIDNINNFIYVINVNTKFHAALRKVAKFMCHNRFKF